MQAFLRNCCPRLAINFSDDDADYARFSQQGRSTDDDRTSRGAAVEQDAPRRAQSMAERMEAANRNARAGERDFDLVGPGAAPASLLGRDFELPNYSPLMADERSPRVELPVRAPAPPPPPPDDGS